jgi:cbb3-type cytochrome oxidase subunit 3
MIRGKNGHTRRPSPVASTLLGGGIIVIVLTMMLSINAWFVTAFMLVFMGVIGFSIYNDWHKHDLLNTRERQYTEARAQIVHAMDRARQR